MSVSFTLRTRKKKGRAKPVARMQSPELGVKILPTTTRTYELEKDEKIVCYTLLGTVTCHFEIGA